MNTHSIPRGPGKVSFNGVTVASGDITALFSCEAKAVATVQGGPESGHYQGGGLFTISFTPISTLAAVTSLYNLIGRLKLGEAVTPLRADVSAVNATTNVLTFATAHGLATGAAVRVAWGDGAAPTLTTGTLSASTVYYVRSLSSTTLSLHDTSAHATANTDAVDWAAWTSGTDTPFFVTYDCPAVLHFADGTRFTFRNAGVVALPTIKGSATEMHLDGTLTLRAFAKLDAETDDANAFYTRDRAAYSAPDSVAATRLTTPLTATWDAMGTAFAAMQSETPWEIAIVPQLADIGSSIVGVASQHLTGLKITVKGKPQGLKTSDLESILLQGVGGGVGAPLQSEEMELTAAAGGAAFTITIADMVLDKRTLMASVSQQRVGELVWESSALPFVGASFVIS